MCLHLKTIPNPYFKRTVYAQEKGNLVTVNRDLVDVREFIEVPCGKCSECRKNKITEIIQRALIESMFSHLFFITLTYDDNHLPSIKIGDETFYYADYEHIELMFKRWRKHCLKDREFRYMCVNEYGERKHRPHFHILLFISKLTGDDENTPYILEEEVKKIGDYFAKNVGTGRKPIYEKLFTYKTRRSYGKVKSNYFVKYVENLDLFTVVDNNFTPKSQDIKAIRYLVGYMNKPDKYEQKVECVIDSYKDDTVLYQKYRKLLKSQCRTSKGFGCGFTVVNGKKYYMDKISVRCSSNTHLYSEIVDSLPNDYEEFCRLYPSFNEDLQKWRERDFYKFFSSWKRCINGMDSEEYMLHCVYLKYFKTEFSSRYKRYNNDLQPKISNYFNLVHKDYIYEPQKVKTVEPDRDSVLFKYLRSMVEESIEKGLPFISFKMIGNQRYVPMCKYYRQRVCTFDDTYRLYQKLGVKNYSEWMSLFEQQLSNRQAVLENGNKFKYCNDDLVEDKKLESEKSVYEILFTDCK